MRGSDLAHVKGLIPGWVVSELMPDNDESGTG